MLRHFKRLLSDYERRCRRNFFGLSDTISEILSINADRFSTHCSVKISRNCPKKFTYWIKSSLLTSAVLKDNHFVWLQIKAIVENWCRLRQEIPNASMVSWRNTPDFVELLLSQLQPSLKRIYDDGITLPGYTRLHPA